LSTHGGGVQLPSSFAFIRVHSRLKNLCLDRPDPFGMRGQCGMSGRDADD